MSHFWSLFSFHQLRHGIEHFHEHSSHWQQCCYPSWHLSTCSWLVFGSRHPVDLSATAWGPLDALHRVTVHLGKNENCLCMNANPGSKRRNLCPMFPSQREALQRTHCVWFGVLLPPKTLFYPEQVSYHFSRSWSTRHFFFHQESSWACRTYISPVALRNPTIRLTASPNDTRASSRSLSPIRDVCAIPWSTPVAPFSSSCHLSQNLERVAGYIPSCALWEWILHYCEIYSCSVHSTAFTASSKPYRNHPHG